MRPADFAPMFTSKNTLGLAIAVESDLRIIWKKGMVAVGSGQYKQ